MATDSNQFAALFNKPTVDGMHALTPREFEHFSAYVLRRAGYEVKEVGLRWLRGIDLEVRLPGSTRIFGGVECKRFATSQLVNAPIVMGAKGAPAVSKPGAKPFVFTTSDFNDAAHQMAEAGSKRAYLLNGAQLVRYINYVRGSRNDDEKVITSLSPEFFAGRKPPLPDIPGSARILTIANNKGGVGKTTTAYYLGAELAQQGKRVLLIDLDSQANLTESCFPEPADGHDAGLQHVPNITHYFAGQSPLDALITSTGKERLSIIPADPLLTLRDLGGSGRPDIELKFARDVQRLATQTHAALGGAPDWIIIDTPPAMSVFTRAGLAAAHYVLAPVRPRRRTLNGTRNMLATLQTMNALTEERTRFIGAVITHWDNLKVSQDVKSTHLPNAMNEFGGGQIFTTVIPVDNQLETLQPGARTGGATAYANLATEIT
jgi:chromosome partitioning protein